jgi:hypothetical protein
VVVEIEEFEYEEEKFDKEREQILSFFEKGMTISSKHPSIFYELNRVLVESVVNNKETVLCDMPELLMRM